MEHVNRMRQDRIGNGSLTFSEIFLNYRMYSAAIISLYIHVIVMQRRTLIRSNNRESIHFENACTGFGHVNYARTTTNQLLYRHTCARSKLEFRYTTKWSLIWCSCLSSCSVHAPYSYLRILIGPMVRICGIHFHRVEWLIRIPSHYCFFLLFFVFTSGRRSYSPITKRLHAELALWQACDIINTMLWPK